MDSIAADPAPIDLVGLTRALVDIDSTTGREAEVGRWLAQYLRHQGFSVVEQPVEGARFNVLATTQSAPPVVLSTHLDCVPGFFPSRIEGDRLYGRGTCDAKGILAAQVAAADLLRRRKESRVGLLFVVGEERGSDGARVANGAADHCQFLVNGEPTDNRLGLATRGMLRLRLRASGRAAHSSYPELGESAIEKIVTVLGRLRTLELPADPFLGQTHYTVGLISGGVAPNVVPPAAEAEVMFRTVGDAAEIRQRLRSLEPLVAIEDVMEIPPVQLTQVPGFETAVFPYTTDIPLLVKWGQPLLFGPGSVHVAHTAAEYVSIPELEAAVEGYIRIAHHLLDLS